MIKIKKSIDTGDESTSPPRWRQKISTVLIRVPTLMKADILALIEGKELTQTTTQNHIIKTNKQTKEEKRNECSCKILGYDNIGLPKIVECYYCKTMSME